MEQPAMADKDWFLKMFMQDWELRGERNPMDLGMDVFRGIKFICTVPTDIMAAGGMAPVEFIGRELDKSTTP